MKTRILALIFGLLACSPAWAAISVVNIPTALNTNVGGASISFSTQCNAGTDFLTIGITSYGTVDPTTNLTFISGATFGGAPLTLQTYDSTISPDSPAEDTHILTLVAPITGSSQSLVVNYSSNNPYGAVIQPICWSGVDPATPVGDKGSAYVAIDTSPRSDGVTVAPAGGFALDQWGSSAAISFGAGQTSAYNAAWGGSFAGASYKQDATAMSVTFTGNPRVAHSWIEIQATGVGGTPVRHTVINQ